MGHLSCIGVVYAEKEKIFWIIKQKHTNKSNEMEKTLEIVGEKIYILGIPL